MINYQDVAEKIAYNLTMEYIKQNNLLQCKQADISSIVQNIENIYKEFLIDLMNQTDFLEHLEVCFEAEK